MQYKQEYEQLYSNMVINPQHENEVKATAQEILKYRKRFEVVANYAGGCIPWYFLGIVYMREEGCLFKGHIHNGDSLKRRTVNVPAGRPAINPKSALDGYTFEESALDLISLKQWDKVQLWDIATLLYYLEANNGFGYRNPDHPINTPYLWSFTNHYTKGYYVADHVFDPIKVNNSCGAAPLLRYLTDKTLNIV